MSYKTGTSNGSDSPRNNPKYYHEKEIYTQKSWKADALTDESDQDSEGSFLHYVSGRLPPRHSRTSRQESLSPQRIKKQHNNNFGVENGIYFKPFYSPETLQKFSQLPLSDLQSSPPLLKPQKPFTLKPCSIENDLSELQTDEEIATFDKETTEKVHISNHTIIKTNSKVQINRCTVHNVENQSMHGAAQQPKTSISLIDPELMISPQMPKTKYYRVIMIGNPHEDKCIGSITSKLEQALENNIDKDFTCIKKVFNDCAKHVPAVNWPKKKSLVALDHSSFCSGSFLDALRYLEAFGGKQRTHDTPFYVSKNKGTEVQDNIDLCIVFIDVHRYDQIDMNTLKRIAEYTVIVPLLTHDVATYPMQSNPNLIEYQKDIGMYLNGAGIVYSNLDGNRERVSASQTHKQDEDHLNHVIAFKNSPITVQHFLDLDPAQLCIALTALKPPKCAHKYKRHVHYEPDPEFLTHLKSGVAFGTRTVITMIKWNLICLGVMTIVGYAMYKVPYYRTTNHDIVDNFCSSMLHEVPLLESKERLSSPFLASEGNEVYNREINGSLFSADWHVNQSYVANIVLDKCMNLPLNPNDHYNKQCPLLVYSSKDRNGTYTFIPTTSLDLRRWIFDFVSQVSQIAGSIHYNTVHSFRYYTTSFYMNSNDKQKLRENNTHAPDNKCKCEPNNLLTKIINTLFPFAPCVVCRLNH